MSQGNFELSRIAAAVSVYKVRASSWGSLFDCAMRFEGEQLLGMRKPSGIRAHLGSSIHHGTAVFDSSKITGSGVTVDDAVGEFITALQNPQYDVDFKGDSITLREAESIGAQLIIKYCRDVSPTMDFEAVEMTTTPLQINCGSVIIELTGTLDRSRVRKTTRGRGIDDIKTGYMAVDKDGRAKTKGFVAQLGTYELLYEHTTGNQITEDAGIIGLKTSGKPEIGYAEVKDAKQILIGTDAEPGLLEMAQMYFKAGLFPPNPVSMCCNPKYCARWDSCSFKGDK